MSREHPELLYRRRRAFSPFINFFSTQLPEFGPEGSKDYIWDDPLPPKGSGGFVAETSALFTHSEQGDTRRELLIPEVASVPFASPSLGCGKFPTAPRRSQISPAHPSPVTSAGRFASQLQRAGEMRAREVSPPGWGSGGTRTPQPGLAVPSAGRRGPEGSDGAGARSGGAATRPGAPQLAEKVQNNNTAKNNRKKVPDNNRNKNPPSPRIAPGRALPERRRLS